MRKKSNLTLTKKKGFRKQKQYRELLNQGHDDQPKLSSFFKKRKMDCFTPLKSPRTKTFSKLTPSKSPYRKRFRRLFSFEGDGEGSEGIPPEMLLPYTYTTQDVQTPDICPSTLQSHGACGDNTDVNLSQTEILNATGWSDKSHESLWAFTLRDVYELSPKSSSRDGQRKLQLFPPDGAEDNTSQSFQDKFERTTDGCSGTESYPIEEEHHRTSEEIQEMSRLMPFVLECLASVGLNNVFLDYFRQLQSGVQTTENIAFLLWTDVVQWYNEPTAASMRYNSDTKKFWRLGWKLFGVKFLNFMSGYKNTTQIMEGSAERGKCDPKQSNINFIVPSVQNLSEFTPYGNLFTGVKKPGIFNDVMHTVSSSFKHSSLCLTFDGKKIKQGLGKSSGDIDILGFESGLSLSQRLIVYHARKEGYENMLSQLAGHELELDVKHLLVDKKKKLLSDLLMSHTIISNDIIDIQEVKRKKEYARKKFIERGGNDWRQSKFVYVISAIDAYIHDIDKYISMATNVMENLRQTIVHLQSSQHLYVKDPVMNLHQHERYVSLTDDYLVDADGYVDTRKIRQRTDMWHEIRNKALITGSTMYKCLGLDGLKKQKEHFDKVVCGVPEPEPSLDSKRNMEHGTRNEINAIATLVGRILPVLKPSLEFREEGCVCINDEDITFMVVSPDGSLYESGTENIIAGVEFKCPVREVHTSFPERYYLQCLSEIESLGAQYLFYISWTSELTTVFKVEKDSSLFKRALDMAKDVYITSRKRPSKLMPAIKDLKKEIKTRVAAIERIGIFPSIVANDQGMHNLTNDLNETVSLSVSNIIGLYNCLIDVVNESYQLLRQKATEAIVFLCCDLDRAWSKERVSWAPVCWFPKGYSLCTETIRRVMEQVLDDCAKEGLYVPACSFDGQWHNISVRSANGSPLTVLQLQKDVWKEVQNLPKSCLERQLKEIKNKPHWHCEGKVIVATNGGLRLPRTSSKGWTKAKNSKKLREPTTDSDDISVKSSVLDLLSEEVIEASEPSITASLAVNFDERMAEEIASFSVDGQIWADSYTDMIDELDEILDDEDINDEVLTNTEHLIGNVVENITRISEERDKLKLKEEDYGRILGLLQTDRNANKTRKWTSAGITDVEEMLTSTKSLNTARDVDLRVVIRYLKRMCNVSIKEYVTKSKKIEELLLLLELKETGASCTGTEGVSRLRKKTHQVKSLSSLASAAFKQVPKNVLTITYAEYIWPDRFLSWMNHSAISNIHVVDCEQPDFWFYKPEYSESRNQLEVRSIDSTHLLTRTRRKCCRGGIEGLDNTPWLKVAKQGKTLLTPVMVQDIIDPMSMSMANTHFYQAVQNGMRENGDFRAASLCANIHEWWRAEDGAGIPALDRIRMRFMLRRRLLNHINFGEFPPPGQYVNGWPIQLFEALLVNIDSKVYLYALCKSGTYNSRAFSSMMGETFFSELTHQDRTGHGTVSCEDFSRYIGKTIEQLHTRLDTSRKFVYRTSSKIRAYVPVTSDMNTEDLPDDSDVDCPESSLSEDGKQILLVKIRDHFFDSEKRRRRAGNRRLGTVSKDRNSLQKGSLGVRWFNARRDESKILPTKKLGIE